MKKLLMSSLCFYTFLFSNAYSSESIGFYSDGSLLGAQSVIDRGTPVHKLFLARGRLYTSDEMHDLLTIATDYIQANFPQSAPLQVGDLSMKNGGEAPGHASHQNGLDGDVVYLNRNQHVQSPKATDWDEDFISGTKVSANFNTENNFSLFRELVSKTPVARIFVDLVVKKNLCDYAKKNGWMSDPMTIETLRRLRPQNLHRTHFHLRILCPANDHECTPQSAPAIGSGCDDLNLLLESAQNLHSC